MSWTKKSNLSQQGNTIDLQIFWISDGNELTDEIIVDVSAYSKDGSAAPAAASGISISSYELDFHGLDATDAKYVFLEIGSTFIDGIGLGGRAEGPKVSKLAAKDAMFNATGDFTLTTIGTAAGDSVRVRATVVLT